MFNRSLAVFLVRFTKINTSKVFIRRINTLCILSWDSKETRETSTGANKDGFKVILFPKFVNG